MVGRNVREHAEAAKWEVIGPARAELDLKDLSAVRAFVQQEKPDVVVHTAGRVGGIHTNASDPINFLIDNVDLGRNVIMTAFEEGVPALVNLATSCMYPRNLPGPLRESDILTATLEPTNEGYAIAKIMAARLCAYIRAQYPDRQYKTLIPCNLYGRFDKFSPESSHLVPAIVDKVVRARNSGADTIEIWGDGTARREFLYAADLADAIWKAVNDMAAVPDIMNVAIGVDHSILEYYETVAAVAGWKGSFRFNLDRPVGVRSKLCDVTKQTAWGWAPRTGLEDGIRQTLAYYEQASDRLR